mgnify:CR=1 FL=1
MKLNVLYISGLSINRIKLGILLLAVLNIVLSWFFGLIGGAIIYLFIYLFFLIQKRTEHGYTLPLGEKDVIIKNPISIQEKKILFLNVLITLSIVVNGIELQVIFLLLILAMIYLINRDFKDIESGYLFRINRYGLYSQRFWFIDKSGRIVHYKNSQYIFIPWQSVIDLNFSEYKGKKLVIKGRYALWSYRKIDENSENSNYQCWHVLRPDYSLVIPIYEMNDIDWSSIAQFIEEYRADSLVVTYQLPNKKEEKFLLENYN